MSSSEWLQKAQAWADADVDADDIARVAKLIADQNVGELETLFCRSAKFGTAGLRELVGPGPGQLNSAVVRRATLAVGKSLLEQNPDPAAHMVVLGWDARLSSERFANDTAGVLLAMGIQVRYFDRPVPTPVVAYALLQYRASAAVVITASHNGPQYNGYKLYAKNGAQIVSPVDVDIANKIEAGPGANDIAFVSDALGGGQPLAHEVEPEIIERYCADIARLRPAQAPRRDLPMVYTPLHGVGGAFVERVFREAGFDKLTLVAEQFEPDGRFPTLKNPDGSVGDPNPETGKALDLARKRGDEVGAELLLANDPDADRLAVNVRDEAGRWRQLTGNQIGILLADYQLSRYSGKDGLVVYSIVSTPMVESIAREYGARAEATFTGFKWLWTAALALEQSDGLHYVFGFEEALGYCVFDKVHDKDGVSAALVFAEMAAQEAASGGSLGARLERLYRKHGLWVSQQVAVRREGPTGIASIREAVSKLAQHPPTQVRGVPVTRAIDYQTGEEARPAWMKREPMVRLELEDHTRLLVRPSGTEPKLKIYADRKDALGTLGLWQSVEQGEATARAFAKSLADSMGL